MPVAGPNRHDEHVTMMMTIQMNLARSGAEPGCASGSCPSGGPPSPRISAIKAASRPCRSAAFSSMQNAVVALIQT